jgi:hypothetical protein
MGSRGIGKGGAAAILLALWFPALGCNRVLGIQEPLARDGGTSAVFTDGEAPDVSVSGDDSGSAPNTGFRGTGAAGNLGGTGGSAIGSLPDSVLVDL